MATKPTAATADQRINCKKSTLTFYCCNNSSNCSSKDDCRPQAELTAQQQDFELLSLQLDELEQQSEVLDEQYQAQKAKEWQLQQQQTQSQQQHQQLKQQQDSVRQQLQQLQLEQQSAQKQLSFSQQNLQRSQQQQQQLQQRHQLVQDQLAEVSEPDGEQHETLQLLLEQRAEVELLVQQKAEALHSIRRKAAPGRTRPSGRGTFINAKAERISRFPVKCRRLQSARQQYVGTADRTAGEL